MQTADLSGLHVTGLHPTNTSESTNSPNQSMKTFLILFTSYVAAGAFGVAFVQTALTETLQQNSGTQRLVRVVR